jgi:hypothetical protein
MVLVVKDRSGKGYGVSATAQQSTMWMMSGDCSVRVKFAALSLGIRGSVLAVCGFLANKVLFQTAFAFH